MTRLLLVRHATSEWNAVGRWQGSGDPPLSPEGRDEAAAAVPRLQGAVEVVVTSDLLRARQTAEILAAGIGLGAPLVEPDVREIDVGDWTGLTMGEVEERYPEEFAAWRARTASSAPGGEDVDEFLARLLRGLGRIASSHDGRTVLVVTHGGAIGRLERHLGCFPGRGPHNLAGRWFSHDGELGPTSDRIDFLAGAER